MEPTDHDRAIVAGALAEAMRAEARRQRARLEQHRAAAGRQRVTARRLWQAALDRRAHD